MRARRFRDCPNCGRSIRRQDGDRFLHCYHCEYTAGLPGLRWLTHGPVRRTARSVAYTLWAWFYWGAKWGVRVSALLLVVSAGVYGIGLLSTAGPDSVALPNSNVTLDFSTPTPAPPVEPDATSVPPRKNRDYVTADDLERHRVELLILGAVNAERRERGLSPLTYDLDLQEIARYHSRDMAVKGYYAHDSPTGETREQRYEDYDYDCSIQTADGSIGGAENIHKVRYLETFRSEGATHHATNASELAHAIVDGWMRSPPHRENILRPFWNRMGIGIYVAEIDGDYVVYATQNFC